MATTKKSAAGRPKIGSSHARKPSAPRAGGPRPAGAPTGRPRPAGAPTGRPRPAAAGAGSKKTSRPRSDDAPIRKPKKQSQKASRIAARTDRAASAPQRPKRPSVEIRTQAAEESKELALVIAKAALDKKAVNIEIVDVVGRVDYTDFLVLMSGRSDRHVLAVADGIEEELVRQTPMVKPTAVEGRPQGLWVILDYGGVVAHVFQEEARGFYDLDTLWQDARKVPVSERGPAPVA